jgi:hypothetical protein
MSPAAAASGSSDVSRWAGLRALEPFRHQVHADHRAGASEHGDARGHVADRPEPEDHETAAVSNRGVLDGLPGGRQHVGQVHEPVVRRSGRHLDRQRVAERHPQELRLPTRHLAVELGVAEQRRTGPLLSHLSGLTLRVQALTAHEAGAARDVERHDDPVPRTQPGDLGADLFDDAHRFVAEHVAFVEERSEHFVQVQVRPADAGRGHAHDHVGRFDDP